MTRVRVRRRVPRRCWPRRLLHRLRYRAGRAVLTVALLVRP